jgi:hypothetical protein
MNSSVALTKRLVTSLWFAFSTWTAVVHCFFVAHGSNSLRVFHRVHSFVAVTCFELVLVLTVSIRREMQRNSRRRQFHQRISFPFHSSSLTQLVKLQFHSSLVAYSSNFSIDLSSISPHMLPDEVHSTSSSFADFRHLLLTRHGYSSLVRND